MIDFLSEIKFRTARSGGKGGQNVNKLETKVIALWHIANSMLFDEAQKEIIKNKLTSRINLEGFLIVKSDATRFQLSNKEIASAKMLALVNESLREAKPRKATRPGKGVLEQRKQSKLRQALKKANRRKDWD